ncbi:4Fe-4S dicluster domain-containing protein [Rubeoparvulum massiliense]|uniref:4Fe-4S dicluster domain-containing protein n=1 Tax=Rubeoparvulum massiliense TaxID=1631346 RepID=UPI00065DDC7D|nr:ferredoxin family protein [Rubeoparvulum massiliense]
MSIMGSWLESLAEPFTINASCLRTVSPFSHCEKCLHACPEEAIKLEKTEMRIESEQCTACGQCIPSCPVHAIEGNVPKRDVIEGILLYEPTFTPTYLELLYYYHKGVQSIYQEEGVIPESWELEMKEANRILNEMALPPITITKHRPDKRDVVMSRRQLFSFFSAESRDMLASTVTPAKWRFNHEAFSLHRAFPDWQFYQVNMDPEHCILCMSCIRTCAMKVFQIEGDQLMIHQEKCVGCNLCEDICQEDAVHVHELIKEKETIQHQLYQHRCPSCHLPYYSWKEENEKCFVCERMVGIRGNSLF